MRVHAVTSQEGAYYVSRCVGANVAAQGATADEAEANLAEAVALSGVTVEEPAEPPRLALIDAAPGSSPVREEEADGPTLVRELTEYGWTAEERGAHVVLTKNGHSVVLPLATRIAPGVYRVIRARIAEAEAAERTARREVFARMDALFAANPWEGDVTTLIRQERDSH